MRFGYDDADYNSYSFTHWDYDGNVCPLDSWYIVRNYDHYGHPVVWNPGWADDFDSFAGLGGCDDIFLFRDPLPNHNWPTCCNPFHYVFKYSSRLWHPNHGDFRNIISASWIGDWSGTSW